MQWGVLGESALLEGQCNAMDTQQPTAAVQNDMYKKRWVFDGWSQMEYRGNCKKSKNGEIPLQMRKPIWKESHRASSCRPADGMSTYAVALPSRMR